MAAVGQSRQTEYYDNITFRKILAKSTINSVLPPFQVLTSDGQGGTYWSTLSSPYAYISAFQYISTPAALYTADTSYNTIQFKAGTGLAFSTTQFNYSTVLYAKAFENIQVPLQSTLISSAIAFSSIGTVVFQTNPNTNTFTLEIVYPSFLVASSLLPLNDSLSTLNIVGSKDIQLSNMNLETVTGFRISTFTSESYISTQNFVSTTNGSLFSNMQPFYLLKTEFSTSLSNLSTNENIANNFTLSTGISSISTQLENYSTFFGNSISSFVNTTLIDESIQSGLIISSLSTFSSLLGQRMELETIASTTNIFGKAYYEYNSKYISNNIYLVSSLVSSVSTSIGEFYQSCATKVQLLSTNTSLLTVYKILNSTLGIPFSTFSTNLTQDIRNKTASTITRVNFVSTLSYADYSFNQNSIANGKNYDLTLSTADFNISTLRDFIDADSKLFLQYNANYSFKNLRRYISDGHVLSVNEFPVCTFLVYNDLPVPNAAFTDYMQFSIYPSTATSTLTQTYSKGFFFPIDTAFYLQNYENSYKVVHLHSSIVYFDNKHAQSNVFGGIVFPNSFTCDCALVNYTTVEWKNNVNPSTINYKVIVENGLNYSQQVLN